MNINIFYAYILTSSKGKQAARSPYLDPQDFMDLEAAVGEQMEVDVTPSQNNAFAELDEKDLYISLENNRVSRICFNCLFINFFF